MSVSSRERRRIITAAFPSARLGLVTVSWLFLAVSIFGALCTLMALHPPQRPGILMIVGFFAAWLTTELALVFITFQVVATVVFVAFGALDSWPGWVGLAITLVSWFGLTIAVRAARSTHQTFADALHETLGIELDRPTRAERQPPLCCRSACAAAASSASATCSTSTTAARRHRLDIYRPAELRHRRAGAAADPRRRWIISNKDHQAQPLMYHLARQGWVCVAINYRPLAARRHGPSISSTASARSPGSASTSRSTAAIPTSSSSPADRPAATSPRMMGLTANDPA